MISWKRYHFVACLRSDPTTMYVRYISLKYLCILRAWYFCVVREEAKRRLPREVNLGGVVPIILNSASEGKTERDIIISLCDHWAKKL